MVNGNTFRITEPSASELEKVKTFMSKHGLGLLVLEVGKETEKPHVHGVLVHTLKSSNFRVQLSKLLDAQGNGKYSAKIMTDLDGALRYACKEGEVLYHYGLDPKTPSDYKAAYWAVNEDVKKDRDRRKKEDWFALALREVKEKDCFTWETIVRAVHRHIPTPTPYSVEANTWKLKRLLDHDASESCMLTKILDRFPLE
jgi:hypothetical protein